MEKEKEKRHQRSLTEVEMKLILDSVNASTYLGLHSDTVSKVRKKMTIKDPKKE